MTDFIKNNAKNALVNNNISTLNSFGLIHIQFDLLQYFPTFRASTSIMIGKDEAKIDLI